MSVKLDTSGADSIIKNMDKNLTKCGRKIGFFIEGRAKGYTPVQTSALRNSIYTQTKDHDGYGEASSAAKSANPKAETEKHPEPGGQVIAVVGPCVDYAEYVEFGTSRQDSQPYFTSAIMDAEAEFQLAATWEDLWEV